MWSRVCRVMFKKLWISLFLPCVVGCPHRPSVCTAAELIGCVVTVIRSQGQGSRGCGAGVCRAPGAGGLISFVYADDLFLFSSS